MNAIRIVDYDPEWRRLFGLHRREVETLLGELAADIHHIGSTSVPGLAAKPKIDMDAVVRLPDVMKAVERIRPAGFAFHGDPYGEGRWTFTHGYGSYGIRLYVCGPDNRAHIDRMLFRDWLRSHSEDAAAYEALKRHLAVEASGNWDFYTDGKSTFVTEIVRRAQAQLISPLDGEMSGRAEEDGGGSAT